MGWNSWDGIHVMSGKEKSIFDSENLIPKHYGQHINDGHEIESMVYINFK